MLHIKLIGLQREKSFAPNSVPHSRKNYIPCRGAVLTTQITGKCKIGSFTHIFNGQYHIDKLDGGNNKALKRDLIAMKQLSAGKVHLIVSDGSKELYNGTLPLVNPVSTHKKLKNTILSLIHFNKTFNNEK